MNTKKVALIGSGELARRLITYVKETDFASIAGMFDDYEPKDSKKYGCPLLGPLDAILELYKEKFFDEVMIAIGYAHFSFRKRIFGKMAEKGVPVATFVHPTAYIADSATVGKGSIILVNSTVEMEAHIGENVFLSSNSQISHDVTIGDHSYLAPSQSIAGNSKIGECCFLGIGTTTINGIVIGDRVIAGAGAVITKNVPSDVLVAGVPATIKKQLVKK